MLRNEIKYLLTYEEYLILSARIRAVLPMDKHAKDPSGYMISSLYLDDQYNSSYYEKAAGTADRRKYRLRAYNFDDSFITLECKEKQRNPSASTGLSTTAWRGEILKRWQSGRSPWPDRSILCTGKEGWLPELS